jgi:membrane protease YdiL (CAAX protease family)
MYLGVFTPGIVALWLPERRAGRPGVIALLRRLLHWQVRLEWYAFALGYMLAVKLAVALVHRLLMGGWPRFGGGVSYVVLELGASMALFWGQAGEEIGWRGFALPRLAERFGLGRASIVLGIIWAMWHLPLFYMPGTTTTGQSFVLYLLQVTALSVAIAWLYVRTSGSLLLVMIMHAAINNTKDIVPSAVATPGNPMSLNISNVGGLTLALL